MLKLSRAARSMPFLALLAPTIGHTDQHEFTVGMLPDTQTYTALRPQIMEAQVKWITDNRAVENLVYVGHLGDLKDRGACVNATLAWPDVNNPSTEWQIVRNAYDQLDLAGIRYGVVPGNHDFDQRNGVFPNDSGGCPTSDNQRPLVGYDTQFPVNSFPATGYGRRLANTNDDNFTIVSSNGMDLLFINLGYREEAPAAGDTATLDWAEGLMTTYPNHLAIVTSHFLVDCNQRVGGPGSGANSSCANTPNNQISSYGANVFDRLKNYPNLFMLIGGHRFGETYIALDRSAENLNPVHAVLANYQHLQYSSSNFDTVPIPGPADGSSGFFKLMRFDMDSMTVDLDSVSPALALSSGITGNPGASPPISAVLGNGDRPNAVFSSRDIDVSNPANLVDGSGNPVLHTQSVSNLVNISFAGYTTPSTGTPPFEISGSRSNDPFFRFLAGVIPESVVIDRCADVEGCSITLTRSYGTAAPVVFGPNNFSYDPVTRLYQMAEPDDGPITNGINANALTQEILGPRADTNCWFSDWDTSGNTGNGDQNGNWAVIIWNTTATNLTCTFRIED